MWFSFVLACVLCTALLYLPGFLVTISTGRMRWHDSIACAPLVGVAFYAVAAIVLAMMGTSMPVTAFAAESVPSTTIETPADKGDVAVTEGEAYITVDGEKT